MMLAFCFIFSSSMISASALEPNHSPSEENEVKTSVMNPVDSSTFYLEDGTKITIAVLPNSLTRSGSDIDSGWAKPTSLVPFQCHKPDGNHFYSVVNNIGETTMKVTCKFNSDEYKKVSREVSPDDRFVTYADSTDGEGLTLKVDVTIKAVKADKAHYSCHFDQSWV